MTRRHFGPHDQSDRRVILGKLAELYRANPDKAAKAFHNTLLALDSETKATLAFLLAEFAESPPDGNGVYNHHDVQTGPPGRSKAPRKLWPEDVARAYDVPEELMGPPRPPRQPPDPGFGGPCPVNAQVQPGPGVHLWVERDAGLWLCAYCRCYVDLM